MLIQRQQHSRFADCSPQDRFVIRACQAHLAYSDDVMPEVPKRLRYILIKHLVEEKQGPVHACSGSSSVCSITEWQ